MAWAVLVLTAGEHAHVVPWSRDTAVKTSEAFWAEFFAAEEGRGFFDKFAINSFGSRTFCAMVGHAVDC